METVNHSINDGNPLAETSPRHSISVDLYDRRTVHPRRNAGGHQCHGLGMAWGAWEERHSHEPFVPHPPPLDIAEQLAQPVTPGHAPMKDRDLQKKEIAFNDLKAKIHCPDHPSPGPDPPGRGPRQASMEDLRRGIEIILAEEKLALPLPDKDRLCKEIRDELMGYGPLEPLLPTPVSPTSW